MSSAAEQTPVSPATNRIVGAALILGLLAIAVLSSLDNLTDIFGRENFRVKAYYNNIGLLVPGAPVSYGGIRVGRVRSISLQTDGRVLMTAELFLKSSIPVDSILSIDSTTVSGDTFVSVIPGGSPHLIAQADNYAVAPILKGYDYFGFSDVSSLAATIGGMIQETFGNVKLLYDGNGKVRQGINRLQKDAPKIKEEYLQVVKRYRKSEKLFEKRFDEINRVLGKAQKLGDKIAGSFTPEQVKYNQACIETISYNRDALKHMWSENEAKFKRFQKNYAMLSQKFEGFGISRNSVIGLLTTDSCMGLPETVRALQRAVDKVSDLSLLKKLGFYFKGKDVFDSFLKDAPPSAKMDAASLYSRWANYVHRRRMQTLRASPTSCEIKGSSAGR